MRAACSSSQASEWTSYTGCNALLLMTSGRWADIVAESRASSATPVSSRRNQFGSSGTKRAPGIKPASLRPSSNGTTKSSRQCNTSVGTFTCFRRSTTSILPISSRSLNAFSGEVQILWSREARFYQLKHREAVALVRVHHEMDAYGNADRAPAKQHPPRHHAQEAGDAAVLLGHPGGQFGVAPRVMEEHLPEGGLTGGR